MATVSIKGKLHAKYPRVAGEVLDMKISGDPKKVALYKCLVFLANSSGLSCMEGKNPTLIITHCKRSYDPDKSNKTIDDVMTEENIPSIKSRSVKARFFGRTKISEEEFIYRNKILEVGGAQWLKSIPYGFSRHFTGRAVDIRTTTNNMYTMSDAEDIMAAARDYFARRYKSLKVCTTHHHIKKGVYHIHLGIDDPPVDNKLKKEVWNICGYSSAKPIDTGIIYPFLNEEDNKEQAAYDADVVSIPREDYYNQGKEEDDTKSIPEYQYDLVEGRAKLPNALQDDGLMDVLRIGDLDFAVCPVNQVKFNQAIQHMRFGALRTSGEPKISNVSPMASDVSISITFPTKEAVNNELKSLIAQFMVTPITLVESRFIARVLNSYRQDSKDRSIKNEDDDKLWMSLVSMNIMSMAEFPEAFEVVLHMEYFEDRVFGDKMKLLTDKKSLQNKYERWRSIRSDSIAMPAYSSMIEKIKDYESPSNCVINYTDDPKKSSLYKEYYQSYRDEYLGNFTPTSELRVSYNDLDFSRETIKNIEKKYRIHFTKSLRSFFNFMGQDDGLADYIWGSRSMPSITSKDIKTLSDKLKRGLTVGASYSMLAFKQSQLSTTYQYWKTFPIRGEARINDIIQKTKDNISGDLKQIGIDDNAINLVCDLSKASIKMLSSWPKLLTDSGQLMLSDYDFTDIINRPEIESVLNENAGLSDLNEYLESALRNESLKVDVQKLQKSYETFIESLVGVALEDQSKEQVKNENLNDLISFLTTVKRNNKYFDLADGNNSIITGIGFNINNKLVPLSVIGWDKPTYQHLGRSDWSVQMNIHVKGDDYIHEIMYMLGKTTHLTKQIQLRNPLNFSDLNTKLKIETDNTIFSSLGIQEMLLTSASVTSVEGQPNNYNISLTLEQADLKFRDFEDINRMDVVEDSDFKIISTTLKSLIIADYHPYYGRLYNIDKLGELVESDNMQEFWKLLSMDSMDVIDKFNFLKILLTPSNSGDSILRKIHPTSHKQFKKKLDMLESKVMLMSQKQVNVGYSRGKKLDKKVVEEMYIRLSTIHVAISEIRDILKVTDPESASSEKFITGGKFTEYNQYLYEALEDYYNGFEQYSININVIINDKSAKNILSDAFSDAGILSFAGFLTGILLIGVTGGVILAIAAAGAGFALRGGSDLLPRLKVLAFEAYRYISDVKMTSVVKDLVIHGENNLYPNVEIKDGLKLNDFIKNLKERMTSRVGGCYPDFKFNGITNIPNHIIDPAFYLQTNDMITYELIQESIEDLDTKMDIIKARSVIMTQQAETTLDQIFGTSEFKYDKLSLGEKGYITQEDIDFIGEMNSKIRGATNKLIDDGSGEADENINDFADLYTKTSNDALLGYVKDEYFLRICKLKEMLSFEIMDRVFKSSSYDFVKATTKAAVDDKRLYNEFIKKYFDDIMKWGGINVNMGDNETLNNKFADDHDGHTMLRYYNKIGSKKMVQVIQKVDRMAKLKKAFEIKSRPLAAKILAEYEGLTSDPRMYEKRGEELKDVVDMMSKASLTDKSGKTARIYPTYKLYFIEEDAQQWGIYNDFYDYSAVQEITVIKEKNSASDTCVIKLSNITGKLTDSMAASMPEIGTANAPLNSMMLQPGTSILVKMGYSNNQVDLPVVFYGKVVEVNAGPVVEVISQSFGTELSIPIEPIKGVHHDGDKDVKGLGDVVTWILQNTPGLKHLGSTGFLDLSTTTTDTYRMSGNMFSGSQGKTKLLSWASGMQRIQFNDPRDDNIYLPYNTSNVVSDNIKKGMAGLGASKVGDFVAEKWEDWIWSSVKFDWFIKGETAWDVMEEITNFQPDTIRTILPYNDNIFPFIPTYRNTIYMGPKNGYYKYTDSYQLLSSDYDKATIIDMVNKIVELMRDLKSINIEDHREAYRGETAVLLQYHTEWVDSAKEVASLVSDGEDLENDLQKLIFDKAQIIFTDGNIATFLGSILGEDINALYTKKEEFGINDPLEDKYEVVARLCASYYRKYILGDENIMADAMQNLTGDFGTLSLPHNKHGKSPQYRKVQEHHMATSHTNILNNNISATSHGWANQIDLATYEDKSEHTDLATLTEDQREDIVIDTFKLDDDIYEEALRPKSVFMQNVETDKWDDANFAEFAMNYQNSWVSYTKDQAVDFDGSSVNYKNRKVEGEGEAVRSLKEAAKQSDMIWALIPSRWRVSSSLLAKEASKMYNGNITIVGNSNIKPYDILHVMDYVNDMQGAVEVDKIVHRFDSQTGFTTTITPNLITSQKDRFTQQQLLYMGRMMRHSNFTFYKDLVTSAIGTGVTVGSLASMLPLAAGIPAGIILGTLALGYFGYKAFKWSDERAISILNNTIGSRSVDIHPLQYKGLQYVAGIDGFRQDGMIRHMHSAALNSNGGVSIVERLAYGTSAHEAEYYTKVKNDSNSWALFKTMLPTTKEWARGISSAAQRSVTYGNF